MGKFLENYSLPKFTQDEGENGNSLIFTKEVEFVITNLPLKETPDPDSKQNPPGFISETCQIFKEVTSIVHKLFQEIRGGGNTSRHVFWDKHDISTITLTKYDPSEKGPFLKHLS